jgi:hypothetical protein
VIKKNIKMQDAPVSKRHVMLEYRRNILHTAAECMSDPSFTLWPTISYVPIKQEAGRGPVLF